MIRNENGKEREKIKKLLFKYSETYGYGDNLRGALISAIQILDLDSVGAIKELDFSLMYESGEEFKKEYLKTELKEGLK